MKRSGGAPAQIYRLELLRHVIYANSTRVIATVDSGAQITVTGPAVAARIGIESANRRETVEMMDVQRRCHYRNQLLRSYATTTPYPARIGRSKQRKQLTLVEEYQSDGGQRIRCGRGRGVPDTAGDT